MAQIARTYHLIATSDAELQKFVNVAATISASVTNSSVTIMIENTAGDIQGLDDYMTGLGWTVGAAPANVLLSTANTWTKSQNVARVALADGANIATDASLGNVFSVTLGGNRTLDNPTNLVDGGTYTWIITQDGAGTRTLAFGALFKWTGGAPVMSTPAASIDTISAVYNGTSLMASLQKAYA